MDSVRPRTKSGGSKTLLRRLGPLGLVLATALLTPGALWAQSRPWVSAYYAGWFWDWHPSPTDAVNAVDMTTMTHFIFGRYAPGAGTLGGSAGQLVQGAGTGHAQVEDALIAKAHASGVKAIAMIGGAGDGSGFVASTASAVRATFIKNILDKCVAKNYDGVDIDWEESLDTTTQRNQLIAFLGELRTAAAQRARYKAPNAPFIITFPGFIVNVNTDLPVPAWKVQVASLVDQYNLMSYGMTYDCCGWQTWLWAPLKGAGPTHPTSIESSIQAYVDAGVPRSKMGMGLGLYGSGYAPPVSGPRQTVSAAYYWPDYVATWADFYEKGMLSQSSYRFDATAQAGYYTYSPARSYQGSSVSMLITEDLQSIAAKGAWAKAGNCGGTIVWVINYGYVDSTVGNPPMQAVKQAFLGSQPPFGSLDTPTNGSTGVTGAVAVSGWALDDREVTKVEVYRDPLTGEPTGPNGKVYLGDATFVPGARPDVAAGYPTYPNADRAGWGYMLLTNMLPGQGNGTFVLHAYARDAEDQTTRLGSKTITCSNASATRPFGTLDTPAQGATASGNAYAVFGWSLTPVPGVIPIDGSTITVFVDGAPVGHPTYNLYRADIATLFPGYVNSDGAIGYFPLDTTTLANGLHSIAWSVSDNLGRTEGIGSRYFWVAN